MALTTQRTQGYELSQDALAQIRPGQSQTLVTTVLGSPQVTNSFGDETAYYYIQTKIDRTAFGMNWQMDIPGGGVALANDVKLIVELELDRN